MPGPFLLDPKNAELAAGKLEAAMRHDKEMIAFLLVSLLVGVPLLWLLWRHILTEREWVLGAVALFATASGAFMLGVVAKAIVFYRKAAAEGRLMSGRVVKAVVFDRGSTSGRKRLPSLDVDYEAVSPSGARVTGSKKVLRSDLSEAPAPGTPITVLFVDEKHVAL